MVIILRRTIIATITTLMAVLLAACEPAATTNQSPQAGAGPADPTIEASPVEQRADKWNVATSDAVTLTLNAPGAKSARIFYRPVTASDRIVVLKKLDAPADKSAKLTAPVKMVPDFAGDIWAEVLYPDGSKKETQPMLLAAEDAASTAADLASDKEHGDESEMSDKFTGGKIETAELVENQPNIKITVDVPAFKLTLWQNGKVVKTYNVGVGRKDFPIGIGMRKATQVIWNPEWVPPDSEWVEDYKYKVEPGERIEADDPRNPLGKLKIPLGDGFLIHQASKPSDLGHLVSHGCVRMLKEDLYDLAEKIMAARNWPVSKDQIEQAKANTERVAAKLDPPLLVDINYDTQVIEAGVLHIYPDVYERNTNTVENLRAELQSAGADLSKLDDGTLKQMLDRANKNEQFVVSLNDLRGGNALMAGKNEPLVTNSTTEKKPAAKDKTKSTRGR